MTNTNIMNGLPEEIQKDVKNTLRAYDEVTIVFENGKYNVSTGTMIKAQYAPDHKVIGYVSKHDVYTETEQIENYINCFHDYPHNYKGRRDYLMLKKMHNRVDVEAKTCTNFVGKLNDKGDFELTGEVVTTF